MDTAREDGRMEIAEFLGARLDEDAAEIARHPDGVDEPGCWGLDATMETFHPYTRFLQIQKKRALAEVDAKRQILHEHSSVEIFSLDPETRGRVALACRRCCTLNGMRQIVAPCPTLRLLALPYADHPDYQAD